MAAASPWRLGRKNKRNNRFPSYGGELLSFWGIVQCRGVENPVGSFAINVVLQKGKEIRKQTFPIGRDPEG